MKIKNKTKRRIKALQAPELLHIDRNIAVGFSSLIFAMMVIVLVTGILFFQRVSRKNDDNLQEIITGILADSINRVSFSGKYHARLLVEQVTQSQPRIRYVFVASLDGTVIAHSDPFRNEQPLDPSTLEVVSQIAHGKDSVISRLAMNGRTIEQIAMPYRSGYRNEISGVIVVGISTEEVRREIRQTWFYLGVLVFSLFVLSLAATYILGKVFAGPVKKMALQLKGILEHAPLLISISDRKSRSRLSSASFESLSAEKPEILDSEIDEVFEKNDTVDREIARCIDDHCSTFMATSFPIARDSKGGPSMVCSMAIDVTDRVRAEESLRRSQANLQITLDSIGDAVISTDADGKIVRMNPVAEALTGWRLSDAKGKLLGEIFRVFQRDTGQKVESPALDIIRKGRAAGTSMRLTLISHDGTERRIANSGAPIRDDSGKIVGAVLVFRDVTEELALQEQLRQSQKMEAIGQLAGGVAHDFNNLLTAIMGNAQLLGMKFPREAEEARSCDEIVNAASRAAELTKQLLAFSRKGQFQIIDVDIHDVINDVKHLLSRTIDKRIVINEDLRADPPFVKGDPTQLQNAILNLAVNARDAMHGDGEITFSTRFIELDEHYCRRHSNEVKSGMYVEISVSDTGVGMDEELQKHIFEPFFTTKRAGAGTGLGLAGVYGCVKSHQGMVRVYSEPGKGSTFKLLIPAVTGGIESPKLTTNRDLIYGHGNILVIDDEAIVRNFASKALRKLGYTVMSCGDGIEGVEYYRKNSDAVDLVILDLIMPKISGEDTFKMLKEINPDVRVIISSGFTQNKTVNMLISHGALSFINKPFRMDELSHQVAYHIRSDD